MSTLDATSRATIAAVLLALLAGCAGAPIQEMSNARQAVQGARSAGASTIVPTVLSASEQRLDQAETALARGEYEQARAHAESARDGAVEARNVATAIGTAAASIARVQRGSGAAPPEAVRLLDLAREAARRGETRAAIDFAASALLESERNPGAPKE